MIVCYLCVPITIDNPSYLYSYPVQESKQNFKQENKKLKAKEQLVLKYC